MINKQQRYVVISWIAVFLWAALIFWFSSQAANESDHLSIGLTKVITVALGNFIPGDLDIGMLNHHLRKTAHFLVFFVFGGLVMNGIRAVRGSNRKGFALALGICVFYSAFDELHQLFVPGRGSQLSDVLVDIFGALTGIVVYVICKNSHS